MRKLDKRKIISALIVLAVLWVPLIWGNSLRTAADSSLQSDVVTDILSPILDGMKIPQKYQERLVRKIAHFSEFFVLGLMLSAVFRGEKVLFPLFVSLSVAAVDETIQYFVPGRSCEFSDIQIDVAGALVAILIVRAGVGCCRRRKDKQARSGHSG